jgi:hypothetical protein
MWLAIRTVFYKGGILLNKMFTYKPEEDIKNKIWYIC